MAKVQQFYGSPGVPLVVEADPGDPARAWASQRARLRDWIGALKPEDFEAGTRCSEWNARQLVQHLASGSAFLGYTLHKAGQGVATDKLLDFDTHETVQGTASMLDGLSLDELLVALAMADASVENENAALGEAGWVAIAEAPPGNLAAHLSLSHFMFDSWVHEYDLMLPRGEVPVLDGFEAEVSARYLVGIAAAFAGRDVNLEVRITDVDVRLGMHGDGQVMRVVPGSVPVGAPVVQGTAQDIMDRTTGRPGTNVTGDQAGLDILDSFGALLD